jgi:hypothetical protein
LNTANEVIEQLRGVMSVFGTKRISQHAQPMSAFGGKADILSAPPYAKMFLSGGVLASLRTW